MSKQHQYKKTLNSRHLLMISLGGVIGTGLFVSSGYTINQAGPFGAVLAYLIGGLIAFCVMQSLGELSVNEPHTGAFSHYAKKIYQCAYWLYNCLAVLAHMDGWNRFRICCSRNFDD